MPFKSKSQQRFMFAAEDRGEVPEGTAARWAHHTKDIKHLPEHKRKKKAADLATLAAECVQAAGLPAPGGRAAKFLPHPKNRSGSMRE